MLIRESQRRQEALKKYLLKMAKSSMDEQEIHSMATRLKALYTSNFRHSYSAFFPIILEIGKNESEYSLDFLTTNLESTRALVEEDYVEVEAEPKKELEFKGLYMPLQKLSDHINLEVARYSYYSISEQKVKDLEAKNKRLQQDLVDATR
jgi:TPP-dependent 2-oxoacid decarboxylase